MQYDPSKREHAQTRATFLELYANATFCLMPPGDSPYRLAIIDALTMGCIPVAFHRAQTEQLWQLQWATWAHSATLTLDYAAVIKTPKRMR
jgi:hypothetical protein